MLTLKFACGSGMDVELDFSDLGPLTTIHSIQFRLGERAIAGDGCLHPGQPNDTWFTLFSRGDEDFVLSRTSQHVWRAEAPRIYDASRRAARWKRSRPLEIAPLPLILSSNLKSPTPNSLQLQASTRLPSPIIGCHATSPVLLDPRITRITHRLRLEVVFSVLGENEKGEPLAGDRKSKFNKTPPEGTRRRLWVEHPVVLRCCVLGPDNTKVPTYGESSDTEESFHDYLARVDIRKTPKAFDMQSSNQGTNIGEGGDLRERVEEHAADCVARCLCFYGDRPVFDLVKRKTAPVTQNDPIKAAYH